MNVLKCILVQKVGFLKYTDFLHGNKMRISNSLTPSWSWWYWTLSVSDIHALTVTNISPNTWCHYYDQIGKNIHTVQTVMKTHVLPIIMTVNGGPRSHDTLASSSDSTPYCLVQIMSACMCFGRSSPTSTRQFLCQIIRFWPTAALYLVIPDILTVVHLKTQASQDITISSRTAPSPQRWRHYDPPKSPETI